MNDQILINDQPMMLQDGQSLENLLQTYGAKEPYVVAINKTFVPHSAYAQQQLQAGDRIEVLQPIQGG